MFLLEVCLSLPSFILEFVFALVSLLTFYGILWVQWAPTGVLGGHLMWLGIELEEQEQFEDLGE